MLTVGQANVLRSNINSFIALAMVGSFALLMAIFIWQASFGENPLASAFKVSVAYEDQY